MSALRYKVGDKVKVREDLGNKCTYGGIGASDEMTLMYGRILTIKSIEKEHGHYEHYHVEENSWNWTDEMFVGYEIPEAKIDNRVYVDEAVESDKSIKDLFDLYNS